MEFIYAIILGIIEGFTEFLPISSTGHLVLAGEYIKLSPKEFQNAFNVIIQLGAILAVVWVYFKNLNPFSTEKLVAKHGEVAREFTFKEKLKHYDVKTINLWVRIIIGFLPAAVLGFLFDDLIDKYLFNKVTVAIALVFYGIIILLIEGKDRNNKYNSIYEIPVKTLILIGFFQCLAMVPGTSRSAATIIGAIILGCSRVVAAEFSFYLAIPTMLGATVLKIFKLGSSFTFAQWMTILLGAVVSFVVALIVIKKFLEYVKKHDFKIFGIYRIVLGILVLIMYFIRG